MMAVTEEVLSQAAAELQQRAAPRAWPLLSPASDSVAVSADYFSPFSSAAVQQLGDPPRARAAARRGQKATSPTTVATGDVSATPLHSGIPSSSPAATRASSSPHRTAATAEVSGTACAASEAGSSFSLLLRSRREQRKQRHRVLKLHPEIFEPPRLPASAAITPCGATSCTAEQRRLTRQNISASLFTDSHSPGVGEQGAARPSSCQSAADASAAAGAFAAAAQREALLVSFAAAAVADASSFSGKPAEAEESGQGYPPHGAETRRNPASRRKPGFLSATYTGEAGEGKSSGRNKNSKRGAAYQQQLMQLQAAAAADDAALLQALEDERERIRQRRLQQEQERLRQQEEERRRQEILAREASAAAAAAAAREEQLRRERQAAEEQRRRLEEAEAKRRVQEEEERRRREQEEEQRRLQQQLQEQQRRQAEEAERQRQQREQEEQQRREKEQQQQMQQAQEQQPPQEAQQKQQDVGALQQQTESAQDEAGATSDTSAAISASNWLPALEAGKPETAYMREVQDLLLEERGMREAHLQQLPGVSEDQVKALRISIKKQINTALNQLASTTSQIIRTCEGIRQFMRGLKGHPPAVSQFFVAQACERLLQLTEKGAQVSTRPSSVWAYAFLIRGMVQEDEKVERAFRAHMYATCCYAAPFYYRKKQGMSVEQFRVARGQREGEDEEAFFSRMVACLRLWLSYLIASHKEEEAWSWLARFLNLNLATAKAVRRVCACALIEGLKIAGPALLKAFGRQFRKVMDLIQNALMPLLLAMQQKNEGTCISMYVTQLRTLLSDYYANNFTLPEPEGKSMKMEATEASPDV